MWLKVGGPSLWAAHKGQKVGGPRPAQPNSFLRQWRPGVDLDPWPFDLKISWRVTSAMGFHAANFVLPKPFRSRVRSRHATDRQTDTTIILQCPLAPRAPAFIRRSGHNVITIRQWPKYVQILVTYASRTSWCHCPVSCGCDHCL